MTASMDNYRERAIGEYGAACRVCESTDDIVVHHRNGDRTNNDLDNLAPLCRGCHAKVHAGRPGMGGLSKELKESDVAGTGRTSISVKEDTADVLHALKKRGESYDELLNRILDDWE